jgi:primosomal protein N' (replication factor Y) (superfamily II helicase)
MEGLFPESVEQAIPVTGGELVATVAVEQAVDRELDYLVPEKLRHEISVGQRVRVPLGRSSRDRFAYVIALKDTTDYPREKLKQIHGIDDARTLLVGGLLDLARWMSRYYVTPLGTVLESVIPSAVKKRTGIGQVTLVYPALSRDQMHEHITSNRRGKAANVLGVLLQLSEDQGIEIVRLATAAHTTIATVRKLAAKGLLRLSRKADYGLPEAALDAQFVPEPYLHLNPDQQKACDALMPQITAGQFSVNLLHGVTGSGKTEVYLHCIQKVVASRRQAIVLVPEIALTPQTAYRFTRRFKEVAVLHSGLSATERHNQWRAIAAGRAQVVIGARSAVFAPVPNLGLIVIDEEHESSYKQETAPRYHARDVAVKRAQMESVPIILGSATPSLEMYHRVRSTVTPTPPSTPPAAGQTPGYLYLSLPSRATAQQLPKVELVDMKSANQGRSGIHLLSPRLESALKHVFENGQQAILLLNRRGYASYICCSSCKNIVSCKYCDVGMVYHRTKDTPVHSGTTAKAIGTGQLHCHYCMAVNPLPSVCPDCGHKLSLFGLGTQRVEEELQMKFPDLTYSRVDSDTMRQAHDYERVMSDFGSGKVKLLMGTQMIAKGLDFPNVTLVGVVSGDTALMLPDFRAAERTFQLITQVAGRAGRGEKPGNVILQTFMPDDPTIQSAIRQNYLGFAHRELELRRQAQLPPFARLVRIVMRDPAEDKLTALAETINQKLRETGAQFPDVHIQGPMPCAIGRIAGHFRQQLVMSSTKVTSLQRVLAALRKQGEVMKGDRIAIDVDPVSLL